MRRIKHENDEAEKNIEYLRKNNEKMARAIRRVKDNPSLIDEVKTLAGANDLEANINSAELDRLKNEI